MVVIIVAGVIVFAAQKSKNQQVSAPVKIWGTLPAEAIAQFQEEMNSLEKNSVNIIYQEFDEGVFEQELIEALASDTAPDAVFLTDDTLLKHENKLFLIGYDYYTQKQFKDNFIEASEVLLREDGLLGFPIAINPLVLYWNRTILNNEGITASPKYWDDFLSLVPRIVKKDSKGNISRSAVAFGEYDNIKSAKDILLSLIQQAGNNVIFRDPVKKKYYSALSDQFGFTLRPADTALNFYAQFSNPTKDVYSWNKAMPNSEEAFIAGDLAFYFGFADERRQLLQKNPNLNFDVSVLPQSRSSIANSTIGKMQFAAILSRSQNISNAFTTLVKITSPEAIKILSNVLQIAPVRRDIDENFSSLSYMDVFRRSALISKIFLDPDREETDNIFKKMIESVVSGFQNVSAAVDRASAELLTLFE